MANPTKINPGEVDSAEIIAAHFARTSYGDLSGALIDKVKAAILDTLGCLLAGTATREIDSIVSLVKERGGRAASTVAGRGFKVPAESAVLANAAAIHQYDFDDTHDTAICHPTSSSLIASLALAEQNGGVSGKQLITAVALGNDLACRLSKAVTGRLMDHLFFRAPIVGIWGASMASAKILGANAQQHLETMGLTLPLVSGTWASLQHGGSAVRSIRDGLSYRNGVLAAELAMRGVRGDREVIDGPYGFYQAFFGGDYSRKVLLHKLGEDYETSNVSLKPWPAIRHTHKSITAVLDIMAAEKLRFADIKTVLLHVGKINQDRCRPASLGSVPDNRMDLLGNLAFVVAAAIHDGGIALPLYRKAELADAVIRDAMPKVGWVYDSALDVGQSFEPAKVEITTTHERHFVMDCNAALGSPARPMSDAQRIAKFRDCAAAAHVPLSHARVDAIIDLVARLDTLPDVAALGELLA